MRRRSSWWRKAAEMETGRHGGRDRYVAAEDVVMSRRRRQPCGGLERNCELTTVVYRRSLRETFMVVPISVNGREAAKSNQVKLLVDGILL
ncbi:hypothetical protein Bca4012_066847 [Brassica carinata]